MPSKDKYTDPKLRDEVKEELHNSDKGGAPGQWSARKAQMMASEYKKRGGEYTTDKSEKDESQKHLEDWGKEDWQTKEGDGNAKQEDGSRKRYLPKKAWENMSEKEKEETDEKKQSESKQGKQYVENTDKAKNSRKKAQDQDEGEEGAEDGGSQHEEEMEDAEADEEENESGGQEDEPSKDDESEEDGNAKAGQKRGRGKQSTTPSKKQKSKGGSKAQESKQEGDAETEGDKSKNKTIGSKHMDAKEPAPKGSADRLPKKDQKVQWKAMPGYVAGKLIEVLESDKQIDGKKHKASEKDPKLVLKSDASGKICVHKPETCFYD